MNDREQKLIQFINDNDYSEAKRYPLSSDASFRTYERLVMGNKTAMVMNAPPEKEKLEPFINIANYLRRRGFSSPECYASNIKHGFLLLEDLGNNSFTNILSGNSGLQKSEYSEEELYLSAIDVLIQLSRSTLPTIMPEYDNELLLKEVILFIDWYLPAINKNITDDAIIEFKQIWTNLLEHVSFTENIVVLRDYHADNLMWIPNRNNIQRVGLLDFQDAVIGAPTYDIVSLLEDARRDVSEDIVNEAITYYLNERKSLDKDKFLTSYAILGAQRNLKIIGIFARLALRDNKLKYLDYLPRVWKHLTKDIEHPKLNDLKIWLTKYANKEQNKEAIENMVTKKYATV